MIYAAALATLAFYAANVPLCFAFSLKAGEGLQFGFGLSAFRTGPALTRARAKKPISSGAAKKLPKPPMRFVLFAALNVLRRAERLSVRGHLGTGDAASTALLCGMLSAILAPFSESEILPSFDRAQLELSGIIEIRAGNIIRAAATGWQNR